MGTDNAQFYLDSSADDQTFTSPAEGAIRKLSESIPVSNNATKHTWANATVAQRTTTPLADSTAATDTTTVNGWAWKALGFDGMESTATDERIVPAGTWTFRHNVTINAPALLQTISATFVAKVYRVATNGGARTLLFTSGTSGGMSASGIATATFSAPLIVLEAGEVLMVGFIWTSAATTAALGGVTPTVVTLNLSSSSDVQVPTGVRTRRYRDPTPEALPAVDSLSRIFHAFKDSANSPDLGPTVQGTDLITPVARSIRTGRAVAESIPTADATDRTYRAFRAPSESIPVGADSPERFFKGGRTNTESNSTTDTLSTAFKGERSISESTVTTDQVGRKFVGTRTASESIPTTHLVPDRIYRAQRPIGETTLTVDTSLSRGFKGGRTNSEVIPTADVIGRSIKQRRFLEEYPTGVTPDFAVVFPTKKIAGIVRDNAGTPVAGATVKLYRDLDDVSVQTSTSAGDGSYQFMRDEFDNYTYYVGAYEEVGEKTEGVTERGLIPAPI